MNATPPPFAPFPKIPRLRRGCVITEKIDGTNASVLITEHGDLFTGSRTRWITPGKGSDNFGFAAHVEANRDTFLALGVGHHFGEWWGQGIQRGYGLDDRRFSLFNTARWTADTVPDGLFVVPVLYVGAFGSATITAEVERLAIGGSVAAPGYMNPEGVVVYHEAARSLFKVTVDADEAPKGRAA